MTETTPHLPNELPPGTSDYLGHRLDGRATSTSWRWPWVIDRAGPRFSAG
jgi:hypothetical protein